MGYSTGYFSENGSFLRMNITQIIEVEISSNFLHSISTSICIRKCNKNWRVILEPFYSSVTLVTIFSNVPCHAICLKPNDTLHIYSIID